MKGMNELFDSFMETSECESEHCKISNKKNVEDSWRCMREKCAKQLNALKKNFITHIRDVKKLLKNEIDETKGRGIGKNAKMNKMRDGLNELSALENELKQPQYVSFGKLEKKMNEMNKYYGLV